MSRSFSSGHGHPDGRPLTGKYDLGPTPWASDSASDEDTSTSVFRWAIRRVLWPLLKWGAIVSLPFAAMIRGALFGYQQQWPLILAFGAGFLAAFCILFLYVTYAYFRFAGPDTSYGVRTFRTKAILVLVGLSLFQGYVLLSPDPAHVKSNAVHAEYSRLHPLLRTSIATILLVDEHLLITDLSRHPSDYEEMGLPTNSRSLHYPQADGYVHAVDLRTNGHYEVRNLLMRGYFAALGFRTLRHIGTADHLHVALPVPRR